jgi:hypothetical protein
VLLLRMRRPSAYRESSLNQAHFHASPEVSCVHTPAPAKAKSSEEITLADKISVSSSCEFCAANAIA